MHWIDWLLVIIPMVVVVWLGLRTQRYVKGVSDFLTGGRVAGRYVLCISAGEAGTGLISLVAMYECYYQSGFAYGWWGGFSIPISIILGLTGYCTYRFRETRAMTLGQFLEIRYSRKFRLFAGVLQTISGVLNYALFPAVGARFFVYVCGLPVDVEIFGLVFPTFGLLMAIFLGLTVFVSMKGGQVTIMAVNCLQGLLSYPIYVIIVAFILLNFSWFKDMAPAILDRPPGQSLINPFDITELRDFNLFFVLVGIMGGIINRMGWSGNQGYYVAAKNAHEQKLAGVLNGWRAGFEGMMYLLLAVVALTYLNSDKYQGGKNGAVACRTELAVKALNDVVSGKQLAPVRQEVINYLNTGKVTPKLQAMLDTTAAMKAKEESDRARIRYVGPEQAASKNVEKKPDQAVVSEKKRPDREIRFQTAKDAIQAVNPSASQTFSTIFGQQRIPMALRYILPIGIIGLFCVVCIFHMISTDMSYILSWSSIIVQDIILPIRKKPFTPKEQIALLRLMIVLVATFAFFFGLFFGQVDYILMFFAITGVIWLGGSGPCIVFGLYWKRGTAAGAWTALISGSGLAILAIIVQKYWVGGIYPWLYENGLVNTVAIWLERLSSPFEPIIQWRMSSEKFPINSQEISAIITLLSVGLYVIVSLITSSGGRVFNMDRMLHRGKYHREGIKLETQPFTFRGIIPRLVGIDNQYTRGDKILAWSVFIWSFGWGFLICFITVAIWNFISPWSNDGWSLWFFINNFLIAGTIGVVSTIWFTIGGTIDLRRLFRDLAKKETNVLDDGRVIGHVSADDVSLVEQVDHINLTENAEGKKE